MEYIIARLIDNANDAVESEKNDFNRGRRLAYYEVLDTIKNELSAEGEDLSKFGLNIDLEKKFFGE